jgi:uncharacterized membrane protein YdcZ (DUF606 family)
MQKVKRYLLRLDNLALMTGVLIALQARVNGELSNQLGNTVQAAPKPTVCAGSWYSSII